MMLRERALVLAPAGRDANLLRTVLDGAGIECHVCRDAAELGPEITRGVAVLLIIEEALERDGREQVIAALRGQPPWSDLPVLVLTGSSEAMWPSLAALEEFANAALIEQPLRLETLMSALQVAMRSRRRQYEIAAHLEAQAREAAQREVLLAELRHRVKNTLAIVRALAHQSLSPDPRGRTGRQRFLDRLTALAGAHDLLAASAWTGAEMRDVVERSLAPFVVEGALDARIHYQGPCVRLNAQAALAVSLVLHELGTNALKYGALSEPAGRLSIRWSADESVTLAWHEQIARRLVQPRRRGFGRTLLERSIAHELGGTTRLEFTPRGVRFYATIPPEHATG